MSIIFELFKSTGKKVCPPNHVRKGNCPLIVRTTSEDLLTANVFGILKNLDPKIWLRRLLGEAIKGQDFSRHTFENLSFEFWKKYRPPINRATKEGFSEVDVTLSYNAALSGARRASVSCALFSPQRSGGETRHTPLSAAFSPERSGGENDGVIFIEAKYLAPISPRTTHDPHRNQIIRYLDLAAYHHLNYPGGVSEFYLILITDTEDSPWILTHYRLSKNLLEGLTGPGLFGSRKDLITILAKGMGWISWHQLKEILKNAREELRTPVEKRFLDDLIAYLAYKIREAERIRNERKQLSLW